MESASCSCSWPSSGAAERDGDETQRWRPERASADFIGDEATEAARDEATEAVWEMATEVAAEGLVEWSAVGESGEGGGIGEGGCQSRPRGEVTRVGVAGPSSVAGRSSAVTGLTRRLASSADGKPSLSMLLPPSSSSSSSLRMRAPSSRAASRAARVWR